MDLPQDAKNFVDRKSGSCQRQEVLSDSEDSGMLMKGKKVFKTLLNEKKEEKPY